MRFMKGYIAVKGFKHGRHYAVGESVNINKFVNEELEKLGLIKWVERPKIIFPDEVKPKRKKRVRKSK